MSSRSNAASVPFMITAKMKYELKTLGYKDEDIHKMKVDEAHEILDTGLRKDVDEGLIPTSSVVDVGQPQSVGRGKPSYCTSTPAASAYSTSVPLMVTAGMKRDLLQLGYSEADVNKMPPHIAHQILGAKLRKRHQPSSYTTRPSSAIPSSFPQHPTDSPADESDDVEVPFSPRTIAGCIALTIVILLLQFS
ncbi:hypothetical protein, variant 1 [Aphanomyces invadans]|uniref:Uncharacterized protein n=1 Tax=Aphanomyces invadans TaxID=157072 RepID=A0A024TMX4_9STRA|nr:hypothetical protein, variant 1 [Aphanomyces invadans]ETV95344.1 hypothetical protein, variant 1 [Aphanomyces invadans]|eukprot:XP_008876045.1 hypothetical protein, variant 1 [Aphanomyces invadans]